MVTMTRSRLAFLLAAVLAAGCIAPGNSAKDGSTANQNSGVQAEEMKAMLAEFRDVIRNSAPTEVGQVTGNQPTVGGTHSSNDNPTARWGLSLAGGFAFYMFYVFVHRPLAAPRRTAKALGEIQKGRSP